MNKRVKKKWMKALRSGEYRQGTGQLKRGILFCCLGVLCDIHSQETGTEWAGEVYLSSGGALPNKVMKWAGIVSTSALVRRPATSQSQYIDLSYANDSGRSFKQIANLIERWL